MIHPAADTFFLTTGGVRALQNGQQKPVSS